MASEFSLSASITPEVDERAAQREGEQLGETLAAETGDIPVGVESLGGAGSGGFGGGGGRVGGGGGLATVQNTMLGLAEQRNDLLGHLVETLDEDFIGSSAGGAGGGAGGGGGGGGGGMGDTILQFLGGKKAFEMLGKGGARAGGAGFLSGLLGGGIGAAGLFGGIIGAGSLAGFGIAELLKPKIDEIWGRENLQQNELVQSMFGEGGRVGGGEFMDMALGKSGRELVEPFGLEEQHKKLSNIITKFSQVKWPGQPGWITSWSSLISWPDTPGWISNFDTEVTWPNAPTWVSNFDSEVTWPHPPAWISEFLQLTGRDTTGRPGAGRPEGRSDTAERGRVNRANEGRDVTVNNNMEMTIDPQRVAREFRREAESWIKNTIENEIQNIATDPFGSSPGRR